MHGRGAVRTVVVGLAAAIITTPRLAFACPRCPTGVSARAQVLQQDFGANLLAALLPFAVVVAVTLWAERIGRAR